MKARRALVAGAVLALASTSGAGAEPFAGTVRTATGTLRVRGRDGDVYQLAVTLQSVQVPGAAARVDLQVDLARCSDDVCAKATSYLVPIGPSDGQVAGDLSGASVTTRFLGHPFTVRWFGEASAACCSVASGVDTTGAYVGEPGGGGVGLVGRVLSVSCGGSGVLAGRWLVSPSGAPALRGVRPPTRTPAAFTRSGGRGPRCAGG